MQESTQSFMIKSFGKIQVVQNFLILTKSIYKNPTSNIIYNDERLNGFHLRLRIRHALITAIQHSTACSGQCNNAK